MKSYLGPDLVKFISILLKTTSIYIARSRTLEYSNNTSKQTAVNWNSTGAKKWGNYFWVIDFLAKFFKKINVKVFPGISKN